MTRNIALLVGLLLPCCLMGAIEIPKASGKALGVTKGKPCSTGLVFIDGRYIEPPYVVERWGVGIRINGQSVVSQVIDWTEFIKTQSGVKVTKSEAAPVEEEVVEEEEDLGELDDLDDFDDFESSLDDLFDDDPKPAKTAKKPAKKPVKKPKPKPAPTVTYSFDGEFVPNATTKALVKKINNTRTDIHAMLLEGNFIFFGENYSRVSGDARSALEILEKLPELERNAKSFESFKAGIRSARLLFLTEPICADLYRNRRDYFKLQTRRDKEKSERDFNLLLQGR